MAGPWEKYVAPAPAPGASPNSGPWTKYGGEQPTAATGSGTFAQRLGLKNPWFAAPLDFLEGIGAGAISTARGVSQIAHKVIGTPEIPASFADAPAGLAGSAGKMIEQGAEFAAPAMAVSKITKGASLLMRMAAEGLTAGGVAGVQSGGDPGSVAAGTAVGAAGPAVGGLVSAAAKSRLAPKLYQSALKPTWQMVKKEGLDMLDTGLKNQIPVSSKGMAIVEQKIKDLQTQINSGITQRAALGRTVDTSKVVAALDDLKKFYADTPVPGGTIQTGTKQVASGVLDAAGKPVMKTVPVTETIRGPLQILDDLGSDFQKFHGKKIPLDVAQRIKINTYQLIKDSYGEMATAKIEGLKQIARGLKEQISAVFPEVSALNEQQSKMLGLDDALYRAVWRIENHQLMGIGSPLAATAGHAVMGGPGAVTAFIGKFLLDDPTVKSKLALALTRAGTKGASGVVSTRMAALKGMIEEAATKLAGGQEYGLSSPGPRTGPLVPVPAQ